MKKIYHPPTLTVHGSATEQTQGRREGDYYDYLPGYRFIR
jgi:hypothetical protein